MIKKWKNNTLWFSNTSSWFWTKYQFLQNSNIELNKNKAIIINEFCQIPSKENVTKKFSNMYSGGDCAQIYSQFDKSSIYVPLTTNANKMARIIANNIKNPEHKYPGTLGSSILRVGNLEITKIGSFDTIDKNKIGSVYIKDYVLPRYISKCYNILNNNNDLKGDNMPKQRKELGNYDVTISNYLRTKNKTLTPQGLNNALGIDRKFIFDCRRRSNPWQRNFLKSYDGG